MTVEREALYKIEGGNPKERARVQEAVDWLLSPDAWGVGKNLLNKAYKLHKKPLILELTDKEESGYINLVGENTVYVNLRQIDKTQVLDSQDGYSKASLESVIAHELVHAGQKHFKASVLENVALQEILESKLFTDEERARYNNALAGVVNAPDYQSSVRKLDKFIDEIVIPRNRKFWEGIVEEPKFQQYMGEIEKPAVHVERIIASRRWEGIRKDYMSSHKMTPDMEHGILFGHYHDLLGLDEKPRAETKKKNSLEMVVEGGGNKTRSGRKAHQRIAEFNGGQRLI